MNSLKTLLLVFVLLAVGCVTSPPPVNEYTLAKVAIDAAKSVDASKHSSGNFHQAMELYKKAEKLFEDREYEQAKEYFIRSRIAAEKAENSSRFIRMKTGEVL